MRVVVLISGRGSNMEALLEADLPVTFAAVISNNPEARGLDTARVHGVQTEVVNHRGFADREAFDAALAVAIDRHAPDLVILAGFMRVLTPGFVRHYEGRMINIHPSLLPAFPGLHTHRRALAEGVKMHGCTVHYVTPEVDVGPIIIQAAVPVLPQDSEQTLAARVLEQEHRIFPQALRWIAEGRVSIGETGMVSIAGLANPVASLISPGLETG
jgi:phosphoribosylglycinamide formyltransferase-1